MSTSKNIAYIPALDHLRAYAAVLTIFFHTNMHIGEKYPAMQSAPESIRKNPLLVLIYEGHTGVALFIALSGFIFTYGTAGKEINYLYFLKNRILRIYPLMLTITFIAISSNPEKFSVTGFICIILPLQNTSAALNISPYMSLFWTIAVEFQCYLIFPFLSRILTERGIIKFSSIFAFTMMARLSARLTGSHPMHFAYCTILGRLDQFLLGMIAATVFERYKLKSHRLRWALPVGGIGLFTALFVLNYLGSFSTNAWWKIIWPFIEGFLWATFIVGYVIHLQKSDHRFWRLVAGIGTISNSMYLIHLIVIILIVQHTVFFITPDLPSLAIFIYTLIVVLPVTIMVSSVSYYVVEKPFLNLRVQYLKPKNNENVKENNIVHVP